jgi:hypothetical protein
MPHKVMPHKMEKFFPAENRAQKTRMRLGNHRGHEAVRRNRIGRLRDIERGWLVTDRRGLEKGARHFAASLQDKFYRADLAIGM